MAYVIENTRIGVQPIGVTSTVKNHPLGDIVTAYDPIYGAGEFIYLPGVTGTVVGSVVLYSPDDFATTLLAANDIGSVAVAMSINVGSQWGWYQIQGKAVVKAGTVADNGNVYATATAGTVVHRALPRGRSVGLLFGLWTVGQALMRSRRPPRMPFLAYGQAPRTRLNRLEARM